MFIKKANVLVLGAILGITGISLVDIKQAVSQPAPPLSSMSITAVQSTNNPSWESIPQGNLSTSKDHGGRSLCVQTEERGCLKEPSEKGPFSEIGWVPLMFDSLAKSILRSFS